MAVLLFLIYNLIIVRKIFVVPVSSSGMIAQFRISA